MDGNELEKLRELVEFLKASGIAEFASEKGDVKLSLKFAAATIAPGAGLDMAQVAQLMAAQGAAAVPAAAAAESVAEVAEVKPHIVKSPIVGTFYESPSPGSPPFVKVGDVVEIGQVLCIVEAMKLMNEIESDAAGEIVERIAAGGQPVEYGQALFAIKVK